MNKQNVKLIIIITVILIVFTGINSCINFVGKSYCKVVERSPWFNQVVSDLQKEGSHHFLIDSVVYNGENTILTYEWVTIHRNKLFLPINDIDFRKFYILDWEITSTIYYEQTISMLCRDYDNGYIYEVVFGFIGYEPYFYLIDPQTGHTIYYYQCMGY